MITITVCVLRFGTFLKNKEEIGFSIAGDIGRDGNGLIFCASVALDITLQVLGLCWLFQ